MKMLRSALAGLLVVLLSSISAEKSHAAPPESASRGHIVLDLKNNPVKVTYAGRAYLLLRLRRSTETPGYLAEYATEKDTWSTSLRPLNQLRPAEVDLNKVSGLKVEYTGYADQTVSRYAVYTGRITDVRMNEFGEILHYVVAWDAQGYLHEPPTEVQPSYLRLYWLPRASAGEANCGLSEVN